MPRVALTFYVSQSVKWEAYFSVLNHIMIGAASLYVTWHCYHIGFSAYTMHVWLSTIGYQLLMTEAILALYSSNGWSLFHVTRTKRTIHWIVQVIGSIFAIAGTVCVYWGRPTHFRTIHSVTGLISLILLVIGAINGTAALWSTKLNGLARIRPIFTKLFHNVVGIAAFVIGMVSLYYGYLYTYFMESETKDIRPWLIGVLGLTTALSLIGAFKSLFNQIQMAAKTCRPADESAAENENRHDFVDFHTKMTGASE